MPAATDHLYAQRLRRYITALRNEKPDMIPIRPFVAEFTARYAGFTCQEVTHDYHKAFLAARKCAAEFDWDAVVANMVYVWTGLTQALGLRYYAVPGVDVPPDVGFQYIEPGEENAFMKSDEYDQLIDDPTAFLYNVWLPRVSAELTCSPSSQEGVGGRSGPGTPPQPSPEWGGSRPCSPSHPEPVEGQEGVGGRSGGSYRGHVALVKSGMAMLQYFSDFGPQVEALRTECGTVSAIAGILKAPFDILADKLRGYIGLTMDMMTQPEKVLAACEALMPHLYHVATSTADPNHQVPIGFWMHRGCVPFVSAGQFESHYWPTVKPIIEELWRNSHQTLFYAEGDWNAHLSSFAELPETSICYHVDKGDIFEVHRKIGHRFCLSGGIPNVLLSHGSEDDVRAYCKKVIDGVASDGGYIIDASAIMQNDTRPENLRALTDFTREYGVYSSGAYGISDGDLCARPPADACFPDSFGMPAARPQQPEPGTCIPWDVKRQELPEITGNAELIESIWRQVDALGNAFIWQELLSF